MVHRWGHVGDAHPNRFGAAIRNEAGLVVLTLRGEIDIAVEDALGDAVEDAVAGARRLTIDLSGVTFMGAVGLSAIVRAHQALGRLKEAVLVRGAPAAVRRVLVISGVDRLVTVQDGPAADAPSSHRVGDLRASPRTFVLVTRH
jgi:anti-sigma B factor antagonist